MDTSTLCTLESWDTTTIPTLTLSFGQKYDWDGRTLYSSSAGELVAPRASSSALDLSMARPLTTNVLTPAERAALRFSDNKAARLLDVAIVRGDPQACSGPFTPLESGEPAEGDGAGAKAHRTLKRLRSLFALDVPMPLAKRQKRATGMAACHADVDLSADLAEGAGAKARVVLPSLVDAQGGSAVSERQRRLIARAQKERRARERGQGRRRASENDGAVVMGGVTRRVEDGRKDVMQGFIPVFSAVDTK
ncbi:hypothetical protein OF83DRAFT_1169357 [Amylostereum chailletii]|nr:hypothetical protein OF83DRAFT_1169357 [Amylostereum chailletii]